MNGIIFDFDGPLFDGRKAAERALATTADAFRDVIGPNPPSLARLPLLSPIQVLAALLARLNLERASFERIVEHYAAEIARQEAEIELSAVVMRVLRAVGDYYDKVAVLSSRPTAELRDRLRLLGIEDRFHAAEGADRFASPKPNPQAALDLAGQLGVQPASCLFLGDSDDDFTCARGAGIAYYHAAWTGEPASAAMLGADLVIRKLGDLPGAILHDVSSRPLRAGDLADDVDAAIQKGDLVFFAGAGVSVPAGVGGWEDHYRPLLTRLDLGYLIDQNDMPSLLQLATSSTEGARAIFDLFKASFEQIQARPTPYHYAMLRAGVARVWTTNYDDLFERANMQAAFQYTLCTSDKMLLDNYSANRLVIKINGDFRAASYADGLDWNMVLSQEQFDLADVSRREIWRLFENDYRQRCIVFVGVSFEDPVLRRIVTVARQRVPRTRYTHYLLAKRERDPARARRQDLHAASLARQSIQTLFLPDFAAVERQVRQVVRRAVRPVVGFSGNTGAVARTEDGSRAAEDLQKLLPGGAMTALAIQRFCARLGRELARRRYRVTSGGAPFVGLAAVGAAFEEDPAGARLYLRRGGGKSYNSAAPAIVVPGDDYQAMRRTFIGELALLIAIAGETYGEAQSGLVTEIEMAAARGIPVLIVPQAGGDAAGHAPRFGTELGAIYGDPVLRTAVEDGNAAIAAIAANDLERAARNELPAIVDRLVEAWAGSSTRAPDWWASRNDPWAV